MKGLGCLDSAFVKGYVLFFLLFLALYLATARKTTPKYLQLNCSPLFFHFRCLCQLDMPTALPTFAGDTQASQGSDSAWEG